jgi:hypothetical protein
MGLSIRPGTGKPRCRNSVIPGGPVEQPSERPSDAVWSRATSRQVESGQTPQAVAVWNAQGAPFRPADGARFLDQQRCRRSDANHPSCSRPGRLPKGKEHRVNRARARRNCDLKVSPGQKMAAPMRHALRMIRGSEIDSNSTNGQIVAHFPHNRRSSHRGQDHFLRVLFSFCARSRPLRAVTLSGSSLSASSKSAIARSNSPFTE